MTKHLFYSKLPPQRSCKQRMGRINILKASLLLALFVNEVAVHEHDNQHSKRVHQDPFDEPPLLAENLPRHFHSRKVDVFSTVLPEHFHHRKFRANSYYAAPILQNDRRQLLIKGAFQPKFAEVLSNLSVPRGRDARFTCTVDHLGGYKVGWVKVDTKAIQAIHDHVITHNPRVSVSHSDHSTWYLLIKRVEESDRGMYMCQVNTDPMIFQMAFLEILHAPDFNMAETSDSIEVGEGGPLRLQCRAYGRPKPRILWRRTQGTDLSLRDADGHRIKVQNVSGDVLELPKVMRSDMGDYVCLAYNGVPPSISKTIRVTVRFHPMIQVPNQLVGAPLGTDVTLVCFAEAYPRSINYWLKDGKVMENFSATKGNREWEIILEDDKYEIELKVQSEFELNMTLKIKNLTAKDMGTYNCVCKNPVGEVTSQIRVYEISNNRIPYTYKGHGSNSISGDIKKTGKQPVKILQRPGLQRDFSMTDKNFKNYLPAESLPRNRGQPSKQHIFYLRYISTFLAFWRIFY